MPPKTSTPETRPRPDEDEEEQEQSTSGSPNEIVRGATGQPGQLAAAVPLNQILTPNQVVKTNISHKAA